MSGYPFKEVEKKWQQYWKQNKSFAAPDADSPSFQAQAGPKAYVLEMLPYPSGRLHMGHVRNYSIGDAIARYKKAKGYNVLHPMGWDAFGLPAENAALENNASSDQWTRENIAAMRDQLLSLGFSYDWDREVMTCDASYYGHEQKLFLDLYKKGLVYQKESWVNWDPVEETVLANEQVVNGCGWRSGAVVERRKLRQWFLKITDYAEELLQDLKTLTGWPEKVVKMQENWIGKSTGAVMTFALKERCETLTVYSTRPETLFGASFCALSALHPLSETLAAADPALTSFIEECRQIPTLEEALSQIEKKGYDTGLKVLHPLDPSIELPLYVANFVLMDYGTGALFGCPAHDARDFEFAQKYSLPILSVVSAATPETVLPHTGDGVLQNSRFLDGLSVAEARTRVIQELEALGKGEGQTLYRLRDWGVSRQRYWGCPIPMIACESCGMVPVPEAQLPVVLPTEVTFGKGGSPLKRHPTWKITTCPSCGQQAERECDTLDTFFESSWYFLRYCCPNSPTPIDSAKTDPWLPVDWYIGGVEHAVMHLLYARFFIKALRDCGYVKISEPFANLMTQGMVCHQTFRTEDGKWLYPQEVQKTGENSYVSLQDGKPVRVGRSEKMSKSKKNVVDPAAILESYGADAARLFVLSDTPPEKDFDWNEESLDGAWRYLNRLWRFIQRVKESPSVSCAAEEEKLRKVTHRYIAKITQAYEVNTLNKAVALCRELTRALEEAPPLSSEVLKDSTRVLLQLLAPLIPHACAEMWEQLGGPQVDQPIWQHPWPSYDLEFAKEDQMTIAVQVNGKLRGTLEVDVGIEPEILQQKALALETVQRDLAGRIPKRLVVVPQKIVNIVV